MLRSSVQVKNVEPELLQAEIAIKQARMQLAILMGIDTGYPVKPTVKLADYEKDMYENALSIDKTIDGNSDLRKLSLQTRTLEQALKVQKAAWFPTLAFTAPISNDFSIMA